MDLSHIIFRIFKIWKTKGNKRTHLSRPQSTVPRSRRISYRAAAGVVKLCLWRWVSGIPCSLGSRWSRLCSGHKDIPCGEWNTVHLRLKYQEENSVCPLSQFVQKSRADVTITNTHSFKKFNAENINNTTCNYYKSCNIVDQMNLLLR